ncbi:delta-lactam-biosynthetic de-N-acetylase [Clostridium sp. HCP1S3_B4]|uniref:delta-lactam-biosynthetic de-N-acetylase n=1 Tax=unclassified Clostridium TaxID=2614128 RepID=UPI001695BFFF|nr:delta-lactam-biosynthetic de-N-acetylase [Clostridiales bacterium]MDY2730285.1 delta-lactam-biosynthetic de-N-acetylase [Clostridium sp.]NLK24304.1 delta-lactam-biosynthetic de-N-acetylase [Clostridiales bacterium]
MRKFFCFTLTIILLITFLPYYGFSNTSDTELNWYYVQREKNQIPECPKESEAFLKDYDAYYINNNNEKTLYLTFDEGYEKGYTNDILDTLKELNIPAAFFVVKPYIDSEPDIIKRMTNEGHLVCNHSNHHPSMASITDNEKFKKELTDVEDAFKELTGQEMPKFFRPPMGKYSKASLEKTKNMGYKTIFWSFAYKDWLTEDQPSKEYAIEKIKNGVHPGAIILLHAVSKTNTEILKTVLLDLQNEGYEFKSLNDLN